MRRWARALAASTASAAGLLMALLLALVPVLVLTAPPAAACSCATTSRAAQARIADVVVAGTVRDVVRDSASVASRLTVAVDVERVHKGAPQPATLEVSTAATSAACGLGTVPVGERYYFFLLDDGARLTANLCGGSGPAGGRLDGEVQRLLGPGTTPGTTTAGPGSGAVLTPVGDGADGADGAGDGGAAGVVRAALPGGVLAAVGLLGLLLLLPLGPRRR